jgi:hypothetical protein
VYFAEDSNGARSADVTVGSVDFGRDIIFDLGDPRLTPHVYVESFTPMEHSIKSEVINVWDRSDPVVVSGVRQLPKGQLNLITLELVDRVALLSTLRSGNVIAFSAQRPEYGLDPLMYFSVGQVAEQRPSPLAAEPARKWMLQVQQVRQPASTYVYPTHGRVWQIIKDNGELWDTPVAANHDWATFERL